MNANRYSAYRTMWIYVFFDLPTNTKTERKRAAGFRKKLLKNGFDMFQFSIYLRHCPSKENAQVHVKRIKKLLPKHGEIGILMVTDKQFSTMELYSNTIPKNPPEVSQQLELF